MPDASLSTSIPHLVRHSFQDSLDQQLIHLYDFDATTPVPLASSSGRAVGDQFIHVVPGLASKPAVPLRTPDLTQLSKRDPFQGPEYGPGEKVIDLEASDKSPYALVHNMYALMREHFMAIPHFGTERAFRPQTSRLEPTDLEIAHLVVQAYHAQERDLICFFNGGPLAGASQPHLHFQFCPFQHDVPPLMQVVATSLDLAPEQVATLPLPWVVHCVRLPPTPSPTQISDLYQTLLRTSESRFATLPEDSLPLAGPKRDSHNLFLTSTHLFLAPRRSRMVSIERRHSKDQGHLSLGGGWEDVPGAEKNLRLSVNGLSVIGYWYVGSHEEELDLKEYGLENVLRECCYVNEAYAP
ncbi:uncharacterized protein JCM15063_002717 [Sporobolomyces koalae]|uniref:uncharacterized protein n=1 Tax=Sporobolomyces koalae TaxID=500713 RepID=UPI00317E0B7B